MLEKKEEILVYQVWVFGFGFGEISLPSVCSKTCPSGKGGCTFL